MSGSDGVRGLEFAGGCRRLAWAAKLFADLGAHAIRGEHDDDVVRARPHGVDRWLNTNKRAM